MYEICVQTEIKKTVCIETSLNHARLLEHMSFWIIRLCSVSDTRGINRATSNDLASHKRIPSSFWETYSSSKIK